jgi:hypothetical protein
MIDRKDCAGCHDDYYNSSLTIPDGMCWSRKSGKMVWRIQIGIDEPPPYINKKKKKVPSCWHGGGSNRTIMVNSKNLTIDGYWKM